MTQGIIGVLLVSKKYIEQKDESCNQKKSPNHNSLDILHLFPSLLIRSYNTNIKPSNNIFHFVLY